MHLCFVTLVLLRNFFKLSKVLFVSLLEVFELVLFLSHLFTELIKTNFDLVSKLLLLLEVSVRSFVLRSVVLAFYDGIFQL